MRSWQMIRSVVRCSWSTQSTIRFRNVQRSKRLGSVYSSATVADDNRALLEHHVVIVRLREVATHPCSLLESVPNRVSGTVFSSPSCQRQHRRGTARARERAGSTKCSPIAAMAVSSPRESYDDFGCGPSITVSCPAIAVGPPPKASEEPLTS